MTHCVVPLALPSDWLIQVLLAAVAEALDGFGDAAQRAVDLFRIHILGVVLHHATRHTNTQQKYTLYQLYELGRRYTSMN